MVKSSPGNAVCGLHKLGPMITGIMVRGMMSIQAQEKSPTSKWLGEAALPFMDPSVMRL